MRKRWVLVIFGLVALGIAIIALFPRPQDDFAILRKFHPEETVGQSNYLVQTPGMEIWERKLRFKEITPDLCTALGVSYEKVAFLIVYPFSFKGQNAYMDLERKEVTFLLQPPPSWFELQMQALKRRFGW